MSKCVSTNTTFTTIFVIFKFLCNGDAGVFVSSLNAKHGWYLELLCAAAAPAAFAMTVGLVLKASIFFSSLLELELNPVNLTGV